MEAASTRELSVDTCQCTRHLIPEDLNPHRYRCVTSDVAVCVYPWSEIFVNKEPALTVNMSGEIRRQVVYTESSTEKQILAATNLEMVAK